MLKFRFWGYVWIAGEESHAKGSRQIDDLAPYVAQADQPEDPINESHTRRLVPLRPAAGSGKFVQVQKIMTESQDERHGGGSNRPAHRSWSNRQDHTALGTRPDIHVVITHSESGDDGEPVHPIQRGIGDMSSTQQQGV